MNFPPDIKDRVAALEGQFKHVPTPVLTLFAMLPPTGEEFSAEYRANFLKALTCVFYMVYGPSDPMRIEVAKPDNR